MKQVWQIVVFLIVLWSAMPAFAEIDNQKLVGEWCLKSQTLNGHDLAVISPKGTLSKKLKAKPGQQYHFQDTETLEITMVDGTTQTFGYKVAGSKKTAISVKKWEWFNVKSFSKSEINATVYGTVKHRFTRGKCE